MLHYSSYECYFGRILCLFNITKYSIAKGQGNYINSNNNILLSLCLGSLTYYKLWYEWEVTPDFPNRIDDYNE